MSAKVDTLTKTTTKIQTPDSYNVVVHNDDTTHMHFVVQLLVEIFGHSLQRAVEITMQVHNNDKGIAGTYFHEMAEQKLFEAKRMIGASDFALCVSIERA